MVTTLCDIFSSEDKYDLFNAFINSQGNSFLIEGLGYHVKTTPLLGLLYLHTTEIYPRTKIKPLIVREIAYNLLLSQCGSLICQMYNVKITFGAMVILAYAVCTHTDDWFNV